MTKIFVGNLPFSATEPELRDLFEPHGAVLSIKIVTDRDTGRSRGFAFVEMPGSEAPQAIEALNGKSLNGRPLRVNEAQERATGGRPRRQAQYGERGRRR